MDLSSLLWHTFVLLPIRFAIFWIFVSANLIVLNSEWRPVSVHTTCPLHVQTQLLDWTPLCFNTGERLCDNVCYTPNQLLYIKPARLTPDITGHLRRLGIGSNLPQKRTRRGGGRKQRKIAVLDRDNRRRPSSTTCKQPHPNYLCEWLQISPGSTPLRRSPGICPRAHPLCSLHSTPF